MATTSPGGTTCARRCSTLHVYVAAENLRDHLVRRAASSGAALLRDATEHARFGRVLHPLFSPRALAPFAPALHDRAATLLDTVAAEGQCDATKVADTYACQALLTVCGLPPTTAGRRC